MLPPSFGEELFWELLTPEPEEELECEDFELVVPDEPEVPDVPDEPEVPDVPDEPPLDDESVGEVEPDELLA